MAEELHIAEGLSKTEKYLELYKSLKSLFEGESNLVANLSNMCAALHSQFPNLWTGFYLVSNNQLVLGPFQGPIACTRIDYGKGVCGTAWKEKRSLVVPDVEAFPGHIACSSLSKSEIVVPIIRNNHVLGVLDIDSVYLNHFDQEDADGLEKLVELLHPYFI